MKTQDIKNAVIQMVEDAGFTPELYIIKAQGDSVSVQFDDEEAVDYLMADVEKYSDAAQNYILQKGREGKRHTLTFQLW
jgi:hypothetical protein